MSVRSKACKVGKIRRKAYRQHHTVSNPHDDVLDLEDLPKPLTGVQGNISFGSVNSNIFKNIHISHEALKQKLPVYSKKDEENLEVKSAIALKSAITKVKARRRKIPFREVLSSAKEFLKKRQAKEKKEKTNILDDLQALQAALPPLEEKNEKKDIRPRTSKSFSQQNAEMMEDFQAYHQCLARSDFIADPFNAVTSILTQHILKS